MSQDFATIDFETTGLKAGRDRVIEIGVVRTSNSGKVVSEFTSLINPKRDVGRTDIHGITPRMLTEAPEFVEIVGELRDILNGAVLVAHNAIFDARFLDAELERAEIGRSDIDALCTLDIVTHFYPGIARRLVDCCEIFELPIREAHAALDDAQMASSLFHHLFKKHSEIELPTPIVIGTTDKSQQSAIPRRNSQLSSKKSEGYVEKLLQQIKPDQSVSFTHTSNESQYLNIVEYVLEDRKLTIEEARDLLDFASQVRLQPHEIRALHETYLRSLYLLAIQDGVLSSEEKGDLALVAQLLSLENWEEVVFDTSQLNVFNPDKIGKVTLTSGMSVCFTGQMINDRAVLENLSTSHGLVVKNNVSKNVDILVVADVDSMSGKAKKARELGTKIVAEQVFLNLLKRMP